MFPTDDGFYKDQGSEPVGLLCGRMKTAVNRVSLLSLPTQSDASGEKLKDLAIEMGLTPSALAYLKQKVPQKTSVLGGALCCLAM